MRWSDGRAEIRAVRSSRQGAVKVQQAAFLRFPGECRPIPLQCLPVRRQVIGKEVVDRVPDRLVAEHWRDTYSRSSGKSLARIGTPAAMNS